jgi:hypothetical protein
MPAIAVLIPQIIAGVQAAINAAPQIEAIVTSAKAWFTSLFEGGLITIAQQKAIHDHIDSISAMAKAGIVLPHWQVEQDPGTVAATAAAKS